MLSIVDIPYGGARTCSVGSIFLRVYSCSPPVMTLTFSKQPWAFPGVGWHIANKRGGLHETLRGSCAGSLPLPPGSIPYHADGRSRGRGAQDRESSGGATPPTGPSGRRAPYLFPQYAAGEAQSHPQPQTRRRAGDLSPFGRAV